MTSPAIGRSIPRRDGRAKVTGSARNIDDLTLPGMLHGLTVRSSAPRGVIKSISFNDGVPWDEIVGVNLTGMYLACKHGVQAIRDTAKKGAVVITGSPTGMFGVTPASIAYSSSKGGVHGMARVMAVDFAPDIRVNVVVPGFTPEAAALDT